MATEAAPRQARGFAHGYAAAVSRFDGVAKTWQSRLVFWVGALAAFAFLADEPHRRFGAVTGGGGLRDDIPLMLIPLAILT